jgi:hypothetical protein
LAKISLTLGDCRGVIVSDSKDRDGRIS